MSTTPIITLFSVHALTHQLFNIKTADVSRFSIVCIAFALTILWIGWVGGYLQSTLVSTIRQAMKLPLILKIKNMAKAKVKVCQNPPGSWNAGNTTIISDIKTSGKKTPIRRKQNQSTKRRGSKFLRILILPPIFCLLFIFFTLYRWGYFLHNISNSQIKRIDSISVECQTN